MNGKSCSMYDPQFNSILKALIRLDEVAGKIRSAADSATNMFSAYIDVDCANLQTDVIKKNIKPLNEALESAIGCLENSHLIKYEDME